MLLTERSLKRLFQCFSGEMSSFFLGIEERYAYLGTTIPVHLRTYRILVSIQLNKERAV